MAVSDWSTTAALNTTVGPVNIAEGCPAANMNNMGREIMAQVKQFSDGLPGAYQGRDQTLIALSALATAANQLIYATGSDTFAMASLTPFARSILDDGDASTARNTLGAVGISSISLNNPGHVRFQIGGQTFQVAWGNQVVAANGATGINYSLAFPSASWPVISGCGEQTTGAQDNNPAVTNATTSGFTIWNANAACTSWWVAVGY